jgi:hypothetical protein
LVSSTAVNPAAWQIRCANAAGTVPVTIVAHAIDLWSVTPVFGVTKGVKVHNLGFDGATLGGLMHANPNGDDLRLFDGSPGSLVPDLTIVGPFTNDVRFGPPTYGSYETNLTNLVQRIKPYSDVLILSFCEQNPLMARRAAVDQAKLRQIAHEVAVANEVAHLNIYDAFAADGLIGYTDCDAAGYMSSNNHCSQAGINEISARLNRALAPRPHGRTSTTG